MKLMVKNFSFLIIMSVFFTCSSSKIELQKQAPININNVYFQKWVAGIESAGSGINIYFPKLKPEDNVVLDSVFFRNMKGSIEKGENSYFATLKKGKPQDIIMSGNAKSEYGNTINQFPFVLGDGECVVSYSEKDGVKYFKVSGIIEKKTQYYPTAPR